jgi:hypothetical protein
VRHGVRLRQNAVLMKNRPGSTGRVRFSNEI